MIKKNDIVDLEIIDNGSAFEGIAKLDGIVIFVPGAIITEKVRAKIIKVTSSYAIARVEKFLVKSKYRVEPFCEVFKYCGGCTAEHINYDMQLLIKKNMVKSLLDKQKIQYNKLSTTIGMGMPYYYRNKVQYPVRCVDKDTKIGFYRKNSHDIVENKCCYIQNRVIDMLAKNVLDELVKEGFKGYDDNTKTGDIRHILIRRGYHTSDIMIVIVVNNEKILSDYRIRNVAPTISTELMLVPTASEPSRSLIEAFSLVFTVKMPMMESMMPTAAISMGAITALSCRATAASSPITEAAPAAAAAPSAAVARIEPQYDS